MTQWQVTYPNTWRDKAVIYPLSVVACLFIAVLLVLAFIEAMGPRRGA
ncbi:hypothetical protein AB4037_23265 [Labrys sp. KB_33_2]